MDDVGIQEKQEAHIRHLPQCQPDFHGLEMLPVSDSGQPIVFRLVIDVQDIKPRFAEFKWTLIHERIVS
jgi:hypothetical protein